MVSTERSAYQRPKWYGRRELYAKITDHKAWQKYIGKEIWTGAKAGIGSFCTGQHGCKRLSLFRTNMETKGDIKISLSSAEDEEECRQTKKSCRYICICRIFAWSLWSESNRQPAHYEWAALPLSHTSVWVNWSCFAIILKKSRLVNTQFPDSEKWMPVRQNNSLGPVRCRAARIFTLKSFCFFTIPGLPCRLLYEPL